MEKDKLDEGLKVKVKKILNIIHKEIIESQNNNAMVVSQYLMDMVNELGVSLADIEFLLRDMDSRIRLIGLSLKLYNKQYIAKLPNDDTLYEFGLWVGMNGPEEVKHDIQKFKLTQEEVDVTLDKTGFLFMNQSG